MNVLIHAHETALPERLRTYAEQKVRRLDRHFDRILDARLEMDATRLKSVEPLKLFSLQVHVNGGILKAKVEDKDLRAGIDRVMDKLDTQLRRRKERLQEHKRAVPAGGLARIDVGLRGAARSNRHLLGRS